MREIDKRITAIENTLDKSANNDLAHLKSDMRFVKTFVVVSAIGVLTNLAYIVHTVL